MYPSPILIAGGSGMIGTALIHSLRQSGASVLQLTRGSAAAGEGQVAWDPYSTIPFPNLSIFNGLQASVHFSGANVAARRWNAAYKDEILRSRVQPARAIASLLANLRPLPKVLVCASAIGIYGDRGAEIVTEDSAAGRGYLSEVCKAWEDAAQPALQAGIRVVHLRFGVVLSRGGGALAKMLPIFRLGLGGRMGSGQQWMSWVALQDAVRAVEFALVTERLTGPVNVVTSNPVTNSSFTRALGRALHRPTPLAVPASALRLAFGEMAEATVLGSTRVLPLRLEEAGFRFEYPMIDAGLRAALGDA